MLCILTKREEEVFYLITQFLTNAEIAERLGLSKATAQGFVKTIYEKTGTIGKLKNKRMELLKRYHNKELYVIGQDKREK